MEAIQAEPVASPLCKSPKHFLEVVKSTVHMDSSMLPSMDGNSTNNTVSDEDGLCDTNNKKSSQRSKAKVIDTTNAISQSSSKRASQKRLYPRDSGQLLHLLQQEKQRKRKQVLPSVGNEVMKQGQELVYQLAEQLQLIEARIRTVQRRKAELHTTGMMQANLRPMIFSQLDSLELERQKMLVYHHSLQQQFTACYASLQQWSPFDMSMMATPLDHVVLASFWHSPSSGALPHKPDPNTAGHALVHQAPPRPVACTPIVESILALSNDEQPQDSPRSPPSTLNRNRQPTDASKWMNTPFAGPSAYSEGPTATSGAEANLPMETPCVVSPEQVSQNNLDPLSTLVAAVEASASSVVNAGIACTSMGTTTHDPGSSPDGSEAQPPVAVSTEANPPIFSGLRFHICGYSKEEAHQLQEQIQQHQRTAGLEASAKVTHVLARYASADTKRAEGEGKTVATKQWVRACITQRQLLNVSSAAPSHRPLPSQCPVPGFENLMVCITGWPDPAQHWLRLDTQDLLQALGAKLCPALTPDVDVLVAQHGLESDATLAKALEWRICVVSHEWIFRCAQHWRMLDMTPYVRRPMLPDVLPGNGRPSAPGRGLSPSLPGDLPLPGQPPYLLMPTPSMAVTPTGQPASWGGQTVAGAAWTAPLSWLQLQDSPPQDAPKSPTCSLAESLGEGSDVSQQEFNNIQQAAGNDTAVLDMAGPSTVEGASSLKRKQPDPGIELPDALPYKLQSSPSLSPLSVRLHGRQPKVLFAEDLAHGAAGLTDIVVQLGGIVLPMDCAYFEPSCTHVVTAALHPSCYTLCACAAGKWLLKPEFLYESQRAKKWVDEEEYEWHGDAERTIEKGAVMWEGCARRWRLSGIRPFSGLQTGLFLHANHHQWFDASFINQVLEAGGAAVLHPPFDSNNLRVLFMDRMTTETNVIADLTAKGIKCMDVSYVIAMICSRVKPQLEQYLLHPFRGFPLGQAYLDRPQTEAAVNELEWVDGYVNGTQVS